MSRSRSEWLTLLANATENELIDQVKIINKFIRDENNRYSLSSLYEHLAILKQIGEFLYGEAFTKRYLDLQIGSQARNS